MSLGEQIKSRRSELNMTQEQLAEKLFISRSTVSNWEIDRNYPDIKLLISLSDVLDISLDKLLKGNTGAVNSIAYDTEQKMRNLKSAKAMKVIIACLCVILAIVLIFFTKDVDLTPERVTGVTSDSEELTIEMNLPFYRTAESYYIDFKDMGKTAELSIGLRYSLSHEEIISIPLYDLGNAEKVRIISPNGEEKEYIISSLFH